MLRKFFEQHARPNYREWLAEPLDERRAKNAVADANNMAARAFNYWEARDQSKLCGARNEGQYRIVLAETECADFTLLRDVAEAYKHVVLDRPGRHVTRYDQTGLAEPEWDVATWDEWRWGEQLVVALDDGSKRPLVQIMQNVMGMWERLLAEWDL